MIYSYHKLKEVCFMIENLIFTVLLTVLVFYAIGLILDLYEARKNKNKIDYFFSSFLLLIVLFFIVSCPIFSWSIYNFM